jgi:hypothetical protein
MKLLAFREVCEVSVYEEVTEYYCCVVYKTV